MTAEDLEQAEVTQDVRVGPGDILCVRVGHCRRRSQMGAWDVARRRAGLHPTAMRFLAERQVAALGSDGNNDTAPSAVADGSDVVGRHYMRHNNLALMAVSRESV